MREENEMATTAATNAGAPVAAPSGRPFYARLAGLGFGLIALAGVATIVVGLLAGDASNAGFGLAFIVIGLIVGGLAWRFGRGALIASGLLALALLGLLGPFSAFNLAHPESAGEFVPIVLTLAGALLGLIGSVVGLVHWRRGTQRAAATSAERLALRGLLGLVAVAVALSLVLTVAGHSTVSAAAKSGATGIQLKNFAFGPDTLQVHAGDTVRLVVRNDDSSLHTFTLPEAGVDVAVPPGSEKLIEFKAPAAGTYHWFCIPHSSVDNGTRTGMVGTLTAQ
jgi:plastocyanin